jgi:hypothetical protein
MNDTEIFIVKGGVDVQLLEQELGYLVMTVESTLQVILDDVYDGLSNFHQQYFVQLMMQHAGVTRQLYQKLFPHDLQHVEPHAIFILNPRIDNEKLLDKLIDYIYQLNSLIYWATYAVLADSFNNHVLNTLAISYNCTQKMVRLIDLISLQKIQVLS